MCYAGFLVYLHVAFCTLCLLFTWTTCFESVWPSSALDPCFCAFELRTSSPMSKNNDKTTGLFIPQSAFATTLPMTMHCFVGYSDHKTWRHVIFFLWGGGYVKDQVFVPPLSRDLRRRIITAISQTDLTCCSGCRRKWIIGFTSVASQRADTEHLRGM